MGFDDHFIETVRNSVSIVDFINRFVPLKKSGKDHGALCPFHSEKTPSFWVSEDKQIFKCFGCGAGGDVFSFAMRMENLSFPEAIRFVAESGGVPLPRSSGQSAEQAEKKRRHLKLMDMVSRLFIEALRSDAGGNSAMRYLRGRDISLETIASFGVGYAPKGNWLLKKIRQQGFSDREAVDCGLAKENERGVYSYFRDRVVFPIRDLSGRVVAFGGRILGDGQPKYLNSPETELYVKSRHLYGLDVARDEIRQRGEVILVEGYFDCVVPHQFGFANVVASLGTSLTEEQVKVLGRYARSVVINYDPDLAGSNAALRSIELLMAQGLQVKVAELPEGHDPDDFIRHNGKRAYRERIERSRPFLEYVLNHLTGRQEEPFSPRGKREIVSGILPFVRRVADKIERAEHLSWLASRLRIDERLLWAEIRKAPRRRTKRAPADEKKSEGALPCTRSEKILLAAVLNEEWRREALEQVDEPLFEGLDTEPVFRLALHLRRKEIEPDVAQLRSRLSDPALLDLIERLAFGGDLPLSSDAIRGSVTGLRLRQNRQRRNEVQAQLKEPGLDIESQMELLKRQKALKRESCQLHEQAARLGERALET